MNEPVVVTLDGPAGVGKSTVSRMVAEKLGFSYLDTGAMYRTLALNLGQGADKLPAQELRERCMGYSFHLEGAGDATVFLCNDRPVGQEIRNETVGAMASRLAAVPVVREYLQEAQRLLGESISLVAEGRDMGIKVFPRARYKFFLDASVETRAERRYKELKDKGEAVFLAELTDQIRQRDTYDRTRAVDPLRPAPDAMLIDTSTLSAVEVATLVLRTVSGQASRPAPQVMPVSDDGSVRMVDIGTKTASERIAMARGVLEVSPATMSWLRERIRSQHQGEMLTTARMAGILAAKQTSAIIPLAHPVEMTFADVRCTLCVPPAHGIVIESEVRTRGRSGGTAAAIMAVQAAAATLFDLCRPVQKDIRIRDVRLIYASGGKSGVFDRRKDG